MPRKPHTEWPDDLKGNISALPGERRKTFGMLDEALLDRVDAEARKRGQTRRMLTERALESWLGGEVDRLREQLRDAQSAMGCAVLVMSDDQNAEWQRLLRRMNETGEVQGAGALLVRDEAVAIGAASHRDAQVRVDVPAHISDILNTDPTEGTR
jgi:predicted transcriptional regulator